MADHTTLPGTGDVIAADDVGGVKHQLVKVEFGAADTATPVSEATPLPVSDDKARNTLARVLQMLLAPLGYDKALQRYRGTVAVETLPTLANVTTVATVTNVASIANRNADMLLNAQVNAAWALNVRARIT